MIQGEKGTVKVEKLSGRGDLLRRGSFISKVSYALQVTAEFPEGLNRIRGQIKILSDNDQFWPIWRHAQFTLRLKDKRSFELYCSNFDPVTSICDIEGTIISINDQQTNNSINNSFKSMVNSRF
jgi:hypothetical protein